MTEQSADSPADAVWFNGQVVTMEPAAPQAQALAVRVGRLIAVGSDADILALAGAGTRRHDLHGRQVIPGLIDGHAHCLWGALRDTTEVFVGLSGKLQQLFDAVRERAAGLPAGQWISGGPWHMRDVEAAGGVPRRLLDAVVPDHPTCLREMSYHTSWANSAALAAAGVDRHTPDPTGGRIGRDAQGEPDGILYEGAQSLVLNFVEPTAEQTRRAVVHMRAYLHGLGITGFKEAMATESVLAAYHQADLAGELQLHVSAHMARRVLMEGSRVISYDQLEAWRRQYRSAHVHTDFIKLFLDGVGPTRTASFLEPYVCADGTPAMDYNPDTLLLVEPSVLAEEMVEFDRRGFTVKMHAVGDRAARAGLDAIAAARRANGDSGLRHEIGHCSFIHADDHPRFAALGAIAETSPRLWFPNPVTPGQIKVLGPVRTNRCHQIRSLMQAGATVVYGSDWPAAAADANPWVGLAGMLTRRNPFGLFDGAVGAEQAITLEQALPLFTANAACAMRLENETGSLRAGKSADFVMLDRALAACTPLEIAQTMVRGTVFGGEVVFER